MYHPCNVSSSTAKFPFYTRTHCYMYYFLLTSFSVVVYIMFLLSIKNLPTADNTLSLGHPRAFTGATA